MHEFDEKYRRMPYQASPEQIEALRRRCIARTTGAAATTRRGGVAFGWAAALVAAVAVAAGIAAHSGLRQAPAPQTPTYEQLLSAAPAAVLQRAAAENCDDLLLNQEL